jgi:hypothetical protein
MAGAVSVRAACGQHCIRNHYGYEYKKEITAIPLQRLAVISVH